MTSSAQTQTWFQIDLNKSYDFTGMTTAAITVNLCAQVASTTTVTVQLALQSASDFKGNYGATRTLASLPACPTMTAVPLNVIVAGQELTVSAVRYVDIIIASPAINGVVTPTVVNVDSVTVSSNVFGPFDFAFNAQPLLVNTGVPPVPNSTVTFAGNGGAGTTGAPGVAVLSSTFSATSQQQFFRIPFGAKQDLSASGLAATFTVCVPASVTNRASYAVQPVVDNALSTGEGNYSGAVVGLDTIATCPALTTLPSLPIVVAGQNLIATAVAQLALSLKSQGSGTIGTATIELDSATVTPGNPVGPYDFAFNAEAILPGFTVGSPVTTIGWQATP